MKTNDVFVERTLPRKGELVAKEKEVVEPFTKLGMTKVSYGNLPLPARLRVTKGRAVGSYFYTGDTLGKIGSKKVIAPFDGTLIEQSGGGFLFNQEDRDFWLLSGVWGEVVSVVEKSSALIRTQMLDVKLAIATDHSYSGELIVFPNPSELLEMQYLQKFSKDSFGKIIYVGHHINEALVKKAHELGVAGLIAGSVDRDALVAAKKTDLFVGAFSGFGVIPTPDYIFDILKGVTNRYIFLQGNKNLLRIPAEKPYPTKDIRPNSYTGQLRSVKKGLLVQVFEEPFFGWTGKVHSMQGSSVQVIIDEGRDPVKIKIPSIISLE